ncbi:MAG: hypothetical protein R3C19_09055 [Planctomycetaceae bacterium]
MKLRLVTLVLAAVLGMTAANASSVSVAPPTSAVIHATSVTQPLARSGITLAQSDNGESGGSTRIRTRGLFKLVALVVVGLAAAGRFIMKMFTGGGEKGGDGDDADDAA